MGAQAHLHYMPQETVLIHENCNKPRVMFVYLIMHITTSHLSSHSLKFMSQGIIISMQSQFHDHTQTILRSQHFMYVYRQIAWNLEYVVIVFSSCMTSHLPNLYSGINVHGFML